MVNENKNSSSQKDRGKCTFFDKQLILPEKSNLIIENDYLKNNYNLEDNKNIQENKIEFCNKKRKNTSFVNKIFLINKVKKFKYSNNFNKINELYNQKSIFLNLKKSKIKKTKNKNQFNKNIICPIIRENYIINDNINDNTNNLLSNNSINSNINCFINNDCNINNNNINDFTCFNINNFNF